MRTRFFQDGFLPSDEVGRKRWLDIFIPSLLLGVGILLWAISLRNIDLNRMGDLGLISLFPPSYYASLLLLSICFVVLVFREKFNDALLTLYVVAMIFIIHGTPQILYGTVRYSWAWKHVGIIDYIQRNAGVDPTIPVLNVYHNWPGFFAIGTLFTEAMGINSALTLAGWAPVFFNLLSFGALLLLFRAFTQNRRLVWLGVWVYFITNWVGQDYFSPQAFSYYFYLIAIGISINWFKVNSTPSVKTIKRWLFVDKAAEFFHDVLKRATSNEDSPYPTRSFQRVGLMLILILILAVVIPSHQLTPFMLISALAALAVFQTLQARSLPILMGVFTVVWVFFAAGDFFLAEIPSVLKYIGQVSGNVSKSLVDLSDASKGQQVISFFSRSLTLLVWGLALVGFMRRWRAGHRDLAAVLLTSAPFALLIGSSYGGEIVFRIYLFALAPMAFFIASAVHPEPGSAGASWRVPVMMVSLNVVLLVFFVFTYFGKDHIYYYTKNEVQASEYLYSNAPPDSLLVEGARNYPSQFLNYEHFTYVPIDREPRESRLKIVDQPVEVLSRWLDNDAYTATYLIITRSQKIAVSTVGSMPANSLDEIEQALLGSPAFEVLYTNPDATIFVLSEESP